MANNILKPTLPPMMRPGVVGAVNMTLTDECTIRRTVIVKDEWGSNQETPLDVETVPCRVLPDNRTAAGNNTIAGRETGREYVRVILPLGSNVDDGDTLYVNSTAEYEILRMAKGQTDAMFIDCECVKVQA